MDDCDEKKHNGLAMVRRSGARLRASADYFDLCFSGRTLFCAMLTSGCAILSYLESPMYVCGIGFRGRGTESCAELEACT
eukprot:1852494-Pleurochrysis_carterae.AAC.5